MYVEYQKQIQSAIEASNLATKPERQLWGEITQMFNEDDDLRPVEEAEVEVGEVCADEEEEMIPQVVESDHEEEIGVRQEIRTIEVAKTTGAGAANQYAEPAEYEEDELEDDLQLKKEEPQSLYQILQETKGKSGGTDGALMGSSHTYSIGSKRKSETVTVAINPDEVEQLTKTGLEQKFNGATSAASLSSAGGQQFEDLSDLVGEHKEKSVAKKRKVEEEKKKFKF